VRKQEEMGEERGREGKRGEEAREGRGTDITIRKIAVDTRKQGK